MDTWTKTPEIVDGKLHKVVSVSSKRRNGKPVSAQITVLYSVWVPPRRDEQRSKTFHVRLDADGKDYEYRWLTDERDNEGHLRSVEHVHAIKAGFVMSVSRTLDSTLTLPLAA